jgi:hypothetical protein
MMERDIARAIDPTLIAVECGFELDAWQADLMRSTAPRVLLCCARQTGKTTATALIALARAMLEAGSLILIVSPSQRQSAEMFRVVMGFYHELKAVPGIKQESVLRAEFENGSRILALPGDERTIRGYASADLVIIDEAARVEDDLITAVRPMLAVSNGRLIALTTPAGKRGWYYDAWTGDASWHRVRVPATDCPRISAEFLAEELRELGPLRYAEEYDLQFLDDQLSVFPSHLIDQAITYLGPPLWLGA